METEHHHHHHHHSSDPQKKDLRFYLRITILCLLGLSFLSYIPYISHKLLPFIQSITFYHKVNVSSICYILLRLSLMLLPVVLFVPSLAYNDYMDKPKMIAKILSLVSFFYYAGMVADIITYNVVGGYVDDGSDPILLKLLWNNIGMMGILFCFIQGTLYLILSKMLRGHKKTVVIMFAVTFIVGAVMPLAYDLYRGVIFTESWYTWFYKNIYFYISQAILLIALIIAASSRWLWSSAFWH